MADLNTKDSFISHLVELRDRILRSLLVVAVLILVLVPFANDLYVFFAKPLMAALPEGTSMISTEPHGPFFVPLKLVIAISVIGAMPYLLHQLWAFVAPGLYDNEKALAIPLLVSSTLLFYLGVMFAYFAVFPLIFAFFTSTAPEGVAVMTDINAYFSFCMKLFFAFGVSFEVPVATVIMVKMGITTPDSLVAKRPYVIVTAFIAGMLMTPPDIFSQTLLALPVWVLFELGVRFSRRFQPTEVDEETEDEDTRGPGAAGTEK
ncbi:MAG: Sec-independent protein translocase protein TatC [Gammaproteobacteria bacterium]|nr:Sec-independent protein translocase protein TatC [Gammaproteobacteria bacterium]